MNYSILIFLAFIHLITTDTACPRSNKCECRADQIRCSDFETFEELGEFPSELTQINILELKPSKQLLIDDRLKLNGLRVAKQVILHNIKGFLVKPNPFSMILADSVIEQRSKNGMGLELALFDSIFEFYESPDLKLDVMCTWSQAQSSDLFDNTILTKFSKISFNGNIIYPKNLCPLVFKNTKIDLMLAYFMNTTNRFDFREIPDSGNIDSYVNSFYLFNSNLEIMNKRVLSKTVFANLKTLHYEGSLQQIESNLLGDFKALKSIKLELYKFKEFIYNENKTEWMLDLNKNEDLTSAMKYMHKFILMIYLTDKSQEFEYSDSDFCLFKNFPSNRFVYPIIKSRPALQCSCTVMWLIKNYKAYLTPQLLLMLKTNSIGSCLDMQTEEFNKKLDQCRFDERLFDCDKERFTTTKAQSNSNLMSITAQQAQISSNTVFKSDQFDSTRKNVNLDSEMLPEEFQSDEQKAVVRALAIFIATVGFISISAILGFVLFMYK